MTVGDAIVRCLAAEDVSFAFGIASGKLAPLFEALSRQQSVRFIGVRHEAAAAHMAAGVFAGTGRIAVALGELGPGGGNLTTGIACAYADNLPMLAITSSNALHLSEPARGMLMELDLVNLFRPITKFSQRIHDPARVPEVLHKAFREALSGRPGPVHVSIPADMLGLSLPFTKDHFPSPARYRSLSRQPAAPDDSTRAAQMLRNARRPLLIAGGGVVTSGAAAEFLALAEALHAPAMATQMGIGAVPTGHLAHIGHGGVIGGTAINRAIAEADVILAVGCRFSSWMWHGTGPGFAPDAALIHVDIDPAMIGMVTPVALGIVADARAALGAISDALPQQEPVADVAGWRDGLRAEWKQYQGAMDSGTPLWGEGGIHPAHLSRALAGLLPDDSLVVYDGGHTTFWSNDILPVHDVRQRFHEPGMGQLGFGTPYALALKASNPEKLVVNVCGDGSFGFTLQELDTARRNGLNIIVVIHNNAAWGVIRAGQAKAGFEFATELEGTDYAAIARGFGCHGEVVTELDDFAPAFGRALASGLPAVLDCRTAYVPHPSMSRFAAMGRVA
ncbi:thiamine pyrophosphate-binding protein [Roseinatronobacter alkalisoli]|uniref:Thiamine pyrophosphate-binding protein n=1 Tax=Roseinatronobacter alkalisoli TaxID=3028235 RepID=A0ABT5TAM5_9RHOB|nr:thiamine pyrophosphate-binding protein [Roseinatronobacter sp. HJB301]MDD7972180.1 thiamine pyrophosphate-binding protein [Roseinatronobacter sp. HJB301]